MSLPKYANLEYNPNSIVQASKTIMSFDKQMSANLANADLPTGTSGIPPKNEYEEFNSNLTEITNAVLELKTYVQDSIKKELSGLINEEYSKISKEISLSQDELRDIEAQAVDETEQKTRSTAISQQTFDALVSKRMEQIIKELTKSREQQKPSQITSGDIKTYNQLLKREAGIIGTPNIINKINLHSAEENKASGVVIGSGRHKLARLYGGSFESIAETKKDIKKQELLAINEEGYIKYLLTRLDNSVDATPEEKQKIGVEIQKKLTELRDPAKFGDEYTELPETADIPTLIDYFKSTISDHKNEIKRLNELLIGDIRDTGTEGEHKLSSIQEMIDIITAEKIKKVNKVKDMSLENQAIFRVFRKNYSDLSNDSVLSNILIKLENLKPSEETLLSEKGTLGETVQSLETLITQIDQKHQAEMDEIEQKYTVMFSVIEAKIIEKERRLAELEDLERAKIQEANRLADLKRQQQAQKALDDIDAIKRAKDKLDAEIADAKLKADALADKEREEKEALDIFNADEIAKAKQLSEKRSLGNLTTSSPIINPIISTLLKITNLISKANVLFNGKIKKNISLLDRNDIDDLVRKYNNVVDNFNLVNFDYIVVAIDNGQELLNQAVNAMNKLNLDVSNGVASYVQKIKGGSRHINNHLQHYKNMKGGEMLMMNQNPHIYKYML